MSFSLIPRLLADQLTDVTPDMLQAHGVRFLMLDFDNTIVPYTTDTPTPEMSRWLETMLASEIGLCVVSNSKKDRVVRFCREWGLPCITHSCKPFSKGILQCRDRFGLDLRHTALAGDQIYTDVLGINSAGGISILVKPIRLHNFWLRLRHWAELPWIAVGRRRASKRPDPGTL